MSVVFVVAPMIVAASWPAFCGVAAAAAAALGYKAARSGETLSIPESSETSLEIPLEGSDIIAESMKRESEFSLTRDDVTATFRRSADGRTGDGGRLSGSGQ